MLSSNQSCVNSFQLLFVFFVGLQSRFLVFLPPTVKWFVAVSRAPVKILITLVWSVLSTFPVSKAFLFWETHFTGFFQPDFLDASSSFRSLSSLSPNKSVSHIAGFPRALENLENHKKSSMHGKIMEFEKKLKNHGKIMEYCEIICVFGCLFSG